MHWSGCGARRPSRQTPRLTRNEKSKRACTNTWDWTHEAHAAGEMELRNMPIENWVLRSAHVSPFNG